MDVRYHYGDGLIYVVVWSTIVVVGLVVSGCLSIVDVVFVVKFVLRAHGWKLQACRAFLMCCISLCNAYWLVQTTLALCARVLKTLFFAVIKWLLSLTTLAYRAKVVCTNQKAWPLRTGTANLKRVESYYRFKCPHINCLEECIGESCRTFRDRLKEHLRAYPLYTTTATLQDWNISLECFTIIDRKS